MIERGLLRRLVLRLCERSEVIDPDRSFNGIWGWIALHCVRKDEVLTAVVDKATLLL